MSHEPILAPISPAAAPGKPSRRPGPGAPIPPARDHRAEAQAEARDVLDGLGLADDALALALGRQLALVLEEQSRIAQRLNARGRFKARKVEPLPAMTLYQQVQQSALALLDRLRGRARQLAADRQRRARLSPYQLEMEAEDAALSELEETEIPY